MPPSFDLADAGAVIDAFHAAAEANLNSPHRTGCVADLPDHGRLVMTGDLHDNAPNLQKIVKFARLDKADDHFLVLHEIMHGPTLVNGKDLSVRTLAAVADLKARYPEQVLLLQSNHELAQTGGEGILKDGVSVVEAFDRGVDFLYPDHGEAVRDAVDAYVRSLLLAVRCANGVMCSHSLPAPRKIEKFDKAVLERVPTEEDLAPGGSGYLMVWGRHHNRKIAQELAQAWGVSVFVMGHQPAEMGYETQADRILILASDHSHGVALPIDLGRGYDLEALVEAVVPLAALPGC